MKILAGLLASIFFASSALAQSGSTPAAGADQPKPPADATADNAAGANTPDGQKPADEPEPDEAPEGSAPVKPADAPQG